LLQFGNNIFYYNRNIKAMIIGFLNIFPQMKVATYNSETGKQETLNNVPILWGPLERSSYMNSKGETVQRVIQLPLLHFELNSMEIDKNRAFAMKSLHLMGPRSGYSGMTDNLMPYPYNFTVTMNIYAKYQEDLYQLVEQIVPLFNYHRQYFTKHPIFPDDITLSHWAIITGYPNYNFNYEYSAEQRRDILSTSITFLIEGWMVREAYESAGLIKEVVANFKDYDTSAGLSQLRVLADPTIRDLIYTPESEESDAYVPDLGDVIKGNSYFAIVVDVVESGHVVVKFSSEDMTFMYKEQILTNEGGIIGETISCEPYDPFKDADYGWSGYSGYSEVSGYSEWHDEGWSGDKYFDHSGWYSGFSSYVISPGYSGYSEFKADTY
jgi:hypothetical protein